MLHKQFYVPQNEVSYIFSFFVQIIVSFINHVLKFKYQFLILCEMQTVPYSTYMDHTLKMKVSQQNYAKICNGCYSHGDVEHLGNHLLHYMEAQ
jgi:hypothetical protein